MLWWFLTVTFAESHPFFSSLMHPLFSEILFHPQWWQFLLPFCLLKKNRFSLWSSCLLKVKTYIQMKCICICWWCISDSLQLILSGLFSVFGTVCVTKCRWTRVHVFRTTSGVNLSFVYICDNFWGECWTKNQCIIKPKAVIICSFDCLWGKTFRAENPSVCHFWLFFHRVTHLCVLHTLISDTVH